MVSGEADSRHRRQSGDEDVESSGTAPTPTAADLVSSSSGGHSDAQIFAIMLDQVSQKVTYEGEISSIPFIPFFDTEEVNCTQKKGRGYVFPSFLTCSALF